MFVIVNGTGVPLLPTYSDPKLLPDGLNVTEPVFGFVPFPLRYNWVASPELSFTLIDPVYAPTAVGFDDTVNVQLAPDASEPVGQLFVCANAPLSVVDDSVTADFDPFVSVAVCDALVLYSGVDGKVSDPGENISVPAVPVPLSVAICGLFAALSVNVSGSLFAPVVVGRNCTETVQEAPPASFDGVIGQVFAEMEKSVPVVIELITSAPDWLFVNVTVFAPEVLPTATLPQLSVDGDAVTNADPPPESVAVP